MADTVDWAAISYAFAVGMVATFNPCGFAMLPAYLSYFLGLEDHTTDTASGALRGLAVGATMTVGFLVVFGIVGVIFEIGSASIQELLPWFTMVIGVGLVGLGVAMAFGFELSLKLPFTSRGATSRDLPSIFVFGVSYALVSLGCSIGLFLAAVSSTFQTASTTSGIATYLAYGLGMGLVLMVITMALALARKSLVTHLRRIVPYVNRIAAALLVLAGMYVTYYGWYELRLAGGETSGGGLARLMSDLQSSITRWVNDVGAGRIGLVLGAVVVATVVLAFGVRSYRRQPDPG